MLTCADCYEYEERAAIMEHEGGMPQPRADKLAYQYTCKGCDCELVRCLMVELGGKIG